MSSEELTEWQAYERVTGPFGGERGDAQAALSAFYVVTALGVKSARIDKMMPRWDRSKTMSAEQMKMLAVAITQQLGGTVSAAPD